MAFKQITAAAVAAALAFSPTAAAASRSAVASAAAAQQEIDPASESLEGSELRRGGILIPLAGLLLIAIAIYLLTKDKEPRSP